MKFSTRAGLSLLILAILVAQPADGKKPKQAVDHKGGAKVVRKEFGLKHITIDFPKKEIKAQRKNFPTKVKFSKAVRRALHSWFTDPSGSDNPLWDFVGMAYALVGESPQYPPDPEFLVIAQELMADYLDCPSTSLRVLLSNESAVNGPSVEDGFWIFELHIKDWDVLHWSMVDRNGQLPTFNYGFN